MGLRVTIFVVKDVYERYLLCVNLANSNVQEESATETSTSGVLYTVRSNAMRMRGGFLQYVLAWADSSCLSLYKAMREPTHGIGEK